MASGVVPEGVDERVADARGARAEDVGREDIAEVQRAVDNANALVSRAESIRKFQILATDLTEASGHLTPKLSIKRNVIMQDFASEIESMYAEQPATEGVSLTG